MGPVAEIPSEFIFVLGGRNTVDYRSLTRCQILIQLGHSLMLLGRVELFKRQHVKFFIFPFVHPPLMSREMALPGNGKVAVLFPEEGWAFYLGTRTQSGLKGMMVLCVSLARLCIQFFNQILI